MKLLAIDTSSEACSVALLIDSEVKVLHELASMQQAQRILPMIDELMSDSNVALNQLDALAFGCGPGSFTGVRIATSVMQGIGYAMNLPLIPISSLAALAQAAYDDLGWKKLWVAIDARIQEVYCGAYQVNSDGLVELVGKEVVCPPQDMPEPPFEHWQGVGNAWDVYRDQIKFKPKEVDASRLPVAAGILPLAKAKFENRQWVGAAEALPTYLRDNVAKKKAGN